MCLRFWWVTTTYIYIDSVIMWYLFLWITDWNSVRLNDKSNWWAYHLSCIYILDMLYLYFRYSIRPTKVVELTKTALTKWCRTNSFKFFSTNFKTNPYFSKCFAIFLDCFVFFFNSFSFFARGHCLTVAQTSLISSLLSLKKLQRFILEVHAQNTGP